MVFDRIAVAMLDSRFSGFRFISAYSAVVLIDG